MKSIRLKPAWSKIILLWLIFALVEFLIIFLIEKDELMQIPPIVNLGLIIVLLFQTFVFCAIFLHLPYFIIEVTNGHLIGPSLLGMGWKRVFIPVEEIDLRSTNTSLQSLGFYVIKSSQGDKIMLWAFDVNQFEKLLMALQKEKANLPEPDDQPEVPENNEQVSINP